MRLRPLLGPEDVAWCFRAHGEGVETELDLVGALLGAGSERLHGKPALDLLARTLEGVESAFLNQCQVRDRELELLRQCEAQGSLDLAQLAECEKVERLRVGDRIRQAFEKLLTAADGTGDALSAWAGSGASGDGKDATLTIAEEWLHFTKAMETVPREAFGLLHLERRRLEMRARAVAESLPVELAPELYPEECGSVLAPELIDAAQRICATSIEDLIEAAVSQAKESPEQARKAQEDKPGIKSVPRLLLNVMPQQLTLAERIRGHLVQGIRSRLEIWLKGFIERLEHALKDQTTEKLQEWERSRNAVLDRVRSALAQRHNWSSVLGELQILRQEIESCRRTFF